MRLREIFFAVCFGMSFQTVGQERVVNVNELVERSNSLIRSGQQGEAIKVLEENLATVLTDRSLSGLQVGMKLANYELLYLDRRAPLAIRYLKTIAAEIADLEAPKVDASNGDTGLSPEFVEWARSKGTTLQPAEWAFRMALMTIDLRQLGSIGDEESVAICLRALKSNQHTVVMAAISALATAGATQYADVMVDAAKRHSKESPGVAALMGYVLVENDDPFYRSRIRRYFETEKAYQEAISQRSKQNR